MQKNKIKSIEDTMNDVISTSKSMRDYLLNDEIEFEERAVAFLLNEIEEKSE